MKNLKIKQRRKNPELVTKRLTSELLTPKDLYLIEDLFSNFEIESNMNEDFSDSFWRSEDFLKIMIKKGPMYKWFYNNEFIGIAGYKIITWGEAELMYILFPTYWGKGFASEITKALIDKAPKLQIYKLIGIVDPLNEKSINVLIKTGFKKAGIKKYKNSPDQLVFIQEL